MTSDKVAHLPQDSAERKRTPLCTGVIDYFPAALTAVGEHVAPAVSIHEFWPLLRDRNLVRLAALAIMSLQQEIAGDFEPAESASFGGLCDRFPEALAAIAQVSWHGNQKHNPGQPLHHARGKSADHADCIARHFVERGGFDGPLRHTACLAWRALALLQEDLESKGAPPARGARL